MLTAFTRALAQMPEAPLRSVVLRSLLAAIVAFVSLAAAVWWLLFASDLIPLPWLDATVDWLGGVAVFVLAWFLFPSMVGIVAGLFLDPVADAVERRHYPTLPPARSQRLGEIVWIALRFFALVSGLNLLALPLYFVPVVNAVLYCGLNGYLLGREYFDLVALRRLPPDRARRFRRAEGMRLFFAGAIIAFLLTLPIINLAVPVFATAFMVHVFQRLGPEAMSMPQ